MTATVFGEVLFDIFSDAHAVAGGAPFNVAWHLNAFDVDVNFVSRVGDDDKGKQLLNMMDKAELATTNVQIDNTRPTGYVNVDLQNGEPTYTIGENVAYDAIEAPALKNTCNVLYHGTLALRSQASAQALESLRASAELVFLDVNLREPYWDKDTTLKLAQKADWLKINADEFRILADADYSEEAAYNLLTSLKLQGLLVTLGDKGACVYAAEQSQCSKVVPKVQDNVIDTVGAGDAFSAVFIMGLLNNWPMQAILARAQAFASHIVTITGATSTDAEFYTPFKQAWQMEPLTCEQE